MVEFYTGRRECKNVTRELFNFPSVGGAEGEGEGGEGEGEGGGDGEGDGVKLMSRVKRVGMGKRDRGGNSEGKIK